MKRRDFLRCAATASGAACLLPSPALAAGRLEWPSWRGPERNGQIASEPWPEKLDEATLKLVWEKPLGSSYSGPIIADGRIFTTEAVDKQEAVRAFRLADGTEQWAQKWDGSHIVPFFALRNGSWIRATPATDGQKLYVGGIRDLLLAFDCATGQEAWRVDFAQLANKVPDFGMVCSPLIDGEFLYIQAGKGLHKLKTSDGSIVWKTLADAGDMMTGGAFSSPIIGTINGKRQLLVQTRTYLAGVDLESGTELWKFEVASFRGMNILTPTVWDNAVFTSSYGGRSLLLDIKTPEPTVRWENKIEGYMSSPVVIGDHLYMHLRNKRFACIDLKTGQETWVTKPYGEYWSLVTNGQQILALDQTGTLRLIAHNPTEFKLIAERRVSTDEAWAHLAVVDRQLIVRSQHMLKVFAYA